MKPTVVMPMLASEKLRSLNRASGSSGSPLLNRCQTTNTASTAMPAMIRPQTRDGSGDGAPVVGLAFLDAEHQQEQPDGAEQHAGDVELVRVGAECGHEAQREDEARRCPTGTLMKKIHSQPRPSTRTPPRIGPTSVAMPAVAPQMPMAAPRRSGGKIRVMTAMVCGVIMAAPRPWSTRASDERLDVAGEPAPQRGQGEDHQAGQVELLGAEPVAQPAGDQQRHGVGQQVGAGDPDHGVDVGVQALHDAGVGHRDDGGVDQDHKEPDHQGPECRPRPGYVFHGFLQG